jgi:hypothetical protein
MENWKTIEGFENYEVSDLGKVRRRLPGEPGAGTRVGKVLKAYLGGNKTQLSTGKAYYRVGLFKDEKLHNFFVHILVAKAFVPNPDPENLTQVNHIDGTKTNNKATNLEWRSRRGDRIHAMKMGLQGSGLRKSWWDGRWGASYKPTKDSKEVWLGMFDTKEEAQQAYKEAESQMPDEP